MRPLLVVGGILTALVAGCGHVTVHEGHSDAVAEAQLDAAETQVALARELAAAGDASGASCAYRTALELISAEDVPERVRARAEALAELILDEYHALLSSLPSLPGETPAWAVVAELDSSAGPWTTYSLEGDGVVYDMPVVMNEKVARVITYFMNKGRRPFTLWLERMGLYEGIIRGILREHGLPLDLIYLAMIESGFNVRAQSYARAVGPWQFIAATARRYDLRITPWVDERRDIVKSTHAACRYLKELYQQFGSWELAMAAYNCGEGKVERHVRHQRTDDYWKLHRLPRQTRDYVPTFMGAMIIAKSPQRYGFSVQPSPPLEWDTVLLKECITLDVAARCAGATLEEMELLNAELRRGCTPPNERYELRIPKGTAERFVAELAKIPDHEKVSWVHHRVRRGETLSLIARQYGTTVDAIKEMNGLRTHLIREGADLVIPTLRGGRAGFAFTQGEEKATTHRVRSGDTLGKIAARYGVPLGRLCAWNGLAAEAPIYPGQLLRLTPPEAGAAPTDRSLDPSPSRPAASGTKYIVRSGDTLGEIALRHGTTVAALKQANGISGSLIRPGQCLVIPGGGSPKAQGAPQAAAAEASAPEARPHSGPEASDAGAPSRATVYIVRRGDSLSRLAARFRVTVEAISQANGLRSTVIHPGQKLLIPRSDFPPQTYSVRRGDSLAAIARQFGVSEEELMAHNGLSSGSPIYPGTVLLIPQRPARSEPSVGG